VILIGIDTLRADHLGVYGYRRQTSPHIDAFARDAVVFERCITPAPRTTPAIASLMTGRYPVNTGVRTLLGDLEDDAVTLAGMLSAHGYMTISIVATGILEGRIERGFRKTIGTRHEKRASSATDAALEELGSVREPYFLWVFYRDPHMEYWPPTVVFDRSYEGPHRDALRLPKRYGELTFRNSMSPREREHAIALYDSEIFYTDRSIGRLLAWIDANDPDALVVLTADHGEALGERDCYYHHGAYLNEPAIRVPLIIRGLGIPPQRVDKVVRLIDVMPTVLGVLGIDPPPDLDGVDLQRLIGSDEIELEAVSESGFPIMDDAVEAGVIRDRTIAGKKRALISGDLKLVYVPRAHGIDYELYDLSSDPEERHDLWGKRDVSALRAKLDAWVARDLELTGQRRDELLIEELSPEEAEQLRNLGYLDP
jgi:arylsulfatase A-like enzyme